ncbi:MAG: hypothetical protein ACOX6S_13925 [Clostridia bacterium]
MMHHEMIAFEIKREEIERNDYRRIVKFFKRLKSIRLRYRERVLLAFKGFEEDTDDIRIFERESVRKYMEGLLERVPQLLYYIADYNMNKYLISACIGEYTFMDPNNKNDVEILIPMDISRTLIDKTRKYAEKIGDSRENADKILQKYPLDVDWEEEEDGAEDMV